MSDNTPELFKGGNSLINSDLFKALMEDAKRLAGGSRGYRRISIRGGRFREIVDGAQMNVNSSGSMNVVILNSAPVARFFYAGTYDPEKTAPPTCWSLDTQSPASDVPEENRQASRCMDCPQNVKGSGQGDSRACRFSQRMALALEGQWDKVYQMQLPATSLFGEKVGDKMPMQAYARYLYEHNAPPIGVVTTMYFDEDSETPKLFFKPLRPLTDEEIEQVLALRDSEETANALQLTVSQSDGAQKIELVDEEPKKAAPKKAAPKKAAPAPAKAEVEEVVEEEEEDEAEEVVEEPKKVTRKAAQPAETVREDLSALVDEWDD